MAGGNYSGVAALCAFGIVAWQSTKWDTNPSREHPFVFAVIALLLSGASLYGCKTRGRDDSNAQDLSGRLPTKAHGSLSEIHRETASNRYQKVLPFLLRTRRQRLIFVVLLIVFRVELLRRILQDFQCSWKGVEAIFLLMLLSTLDFLFGRTVNTQEQSDANFSNSIYEDIYDTLNRSRARYLLSVFLLGLGIYWTTSHTLSSTHVCSNRYIPAFQLASSLLDALILLTSYRILDDAADSKHRMIITAKVFTNSAAALCIAGMIYQLLNGANRFSRPNLSSAFKWSALVDTIAFTVFVYCWLYLHLEIRPIAMVTALVFAGVYVPLLLSTWSDRAAFPPHRKSAKTIGLASLFIGFVSFSRIYQSSELRKSSRSVVTLRISGLFWILIALSFLVVEIFSVARSNVVDQHPITFLMYKARQYSDKWLTEANTSGTLKVAVNEYQARYGRLPPPNFDKWYAFARERGCLVIDNYDQIDRDLQPFWGIEPKTIRQQTRMQHPKYNLVGITIRSGRAEIGPHGSTGRWVADETVSMINSFSQWLPNMNIGINVRDEPQIAAPWEIVEKFTRIGKSAKNDFNYNSTENNKWTVTKDWGSFDSEKQDQWSRDAKWAAQPLSRSIANEFTTPACPKNSRVRRGRNWNTRDFCATCTSPHEMGQFVSDWTIHGDVCHQPDLATLHSFLASPAVNPSTGYPKNLLTPIFSRNKVHGYNDILLPGPADYLTSEGSPPTEKIFSELQDSLYWQGHTPRVGFPNTWQGMEQQRLVHLVNNVSSSNMIPMLLPSSSKFIYELTPATELAPLIRMDVKLTELAGCLNKKECADQEKELGAITGAEADAEWAYRYLYDMDNPTPSGKFLAYLRSNSVPFRSSIFRSWFDERLTPWVHFVPQDSRLQSLHSTLAFFVGLRGKINGRDVEIASRAGEAMFIADQGKKWAAKVLRKEDAEVYLFRLLLEWGRVVDDRRNELGYKV